MTDWLDQLLGALREARVDLSAEDVADVVWLAPHLDPPTPEPEIEAEQRDEEPEETEEPFPDDDEEATDVGPKPSPRPIPEAPRRSGHGRGELYLPGDRGGSQPGGGRPLRAPTGSALPGSMALSRALRPLRRRVPSRTRKIFDVAETVRRIAEEGVWLPALGPARDRWLELSMVVDSGASMGPWRSLATELLGLFSTLGAFRSVRLWSLETDSSPIRLRAGWIRPGSVSRDPRELVDPSGRSLIVILTDCVADSWSDGQVARTIDLWARSGPVALLQVLPEQLWTRSALGVAAAVRISSPGPAVASARLHSRATDPFGDLLTSESFPLPVASLTPEGFTALAKMIAGAVGAEIPGYRLDLAPPRMPPGPITAASPPPSPRERLDRFWKSASPQARRLAGLLAASPAITLPMIRLVRQSLMPEGRQVHEAEVLLGGLLRIVDHVGEPTLDPDQVRYDFRVGLRPLLLDSVPAADALDVLAGVSSYVEENLAHGLDFQAMLADPGSASGSIVPDTGPFARIAAEVLLRLGGDYARLVTTRPVDLKSGPGSVVEQAGNDSTISVIESAPSSAPVSVDQPQGSAVPPARAGTVPPIEALPPLPVSPPRVEPSRQHKLERVRAPRVQITYDVEINGTLVKKELPFVIGVIADLAGHRDPDQEIGLLKDRDFIEIERDNFDGVLAAIGPRLALVVDNKLRKAGTQLGISLRFKSIEDFEPENVVNQIEPLRKLLEARRKLSDLVNRVASNEKFDGLLQRILKTTEDLKNRGLETRDVTAAVKDAQGFSADVSLPETPTPSTNQGSATADDDLLQQILQSSRQDILVASRILDDAPPYQMEMIGQFVDEVLRGAVKVSPDTEVMLSQRIAEIDSLLTTQLNAILHHPEFQKLEASWRGLFYLVNNSQTGSMVKIRIIHATKRELLRDMEKSVEFDQSVLFKKIYEDEYQVFGGEPFGALIGDYEFSKHPQDLSLLQGISRVASAAHAPFLSAASPNVFGLDRFTDLSQVREISEIFRTNDYVKWKAFRESEESRYVALCLPHILMRLPYGNDSVPIDSFSFEEGVDGKDDSKYLWGNTAYALGVRMTEAFARHGWCASIRGVENGGLVQDLPNHLFLNTRGEIEGKCPTEMIITDRREKELSDFGFIPLTHCRNTDYAAFFSVQTCQKPFVYDDNLASINARLSSQLTYVLMTSRFAHYLMSMSRDKIGAWMSREDCQSWLNQWLMNYVVEDDNASVAFRTKYPLREARVVVEDTPNRPGFYRAVAYLRPHFMLDELTRPLRIVCELPASGS